MWTLTDLTPIEYDVAIADVAFTSISDLSLVTPVVQDVALLLQTRTVSAGGGPLQTWTDLTIPTAAQVTQQIQSALILVLSNLPADLPTYVYPQIKEAVRYQAAVLVEQSFFQEQVTSGNSAVKTYTTILLSLIASIQQAAGDSRGGRRGVKSAVMRSTMTDYDPYYPKPPPAQVLEWMKESATSDSVLDGGMAGSDFSTSIDGNGP